MNWISECVTTVSFSVCINGGTYIFFKGRRSLRQRDPLSSLLFGLCLKVFSRSLKTVLRRPGFHYHSICADTDITHLVYANDLLLFTRADESTITLIAECLKGFGDVAGLRPNLNKSNIFAKVDERTRCRLLDIIRFQQGSFLI